MVSPISSNKKVLNIGIESKDKKSKTLSISCPRDAINCLTELFQNLQKIESVNNRNPIIDEFLSKMQLTSENEKIFNEVIDSDQPRDPTAQRNQNPKDFKLRCVLIKAYIDKLCEHSKFSSKFLPLTLRSALCLVLKDLSKDLSKVTELAQKLQSIQDKDALEKLCKEEPLLQQEKLVRFIQGNDSISENDEIANIVTLADSNSEKKAIPLARVIMILFRSFDVFDLSLETIWKETGDLDVNCRAIVEFFSEYGYSFPNHEEAVVSKAFETTLFRWILTQKNPAIHLSLLSLWEKTKGNIKKFGSNIDDFLKTNECNDHQKGGMLFVFKDIANQIIKLNLYEVPLRLLNHPVGITPRQLPVTSISNGLALWQSMCKDIMKQLDTMAINLESFLQSSTDLTYEDAKKQTKKKGKSLPVIISKSQVESKLKQSTVGFKANEIKREVVSLKKIISRRTKLIEMQLQLAINGNKSLLQRFILQYVKKTNEAFDNIKKLVGEMAIGTAAPANEITKRLTFKGDFGLENFQTSQVAGNRIFNDMDEDLGRLGKLAQALINEFSSLDNFKSDAERKKSKESDDKELEESLLTYQYAEWSDSFADAQTEQPEKTAVKRNKSKKKKPIAKDDQTNSIVAEPVSSTPAIILQPRNVKEIRLDQMKEYLGGLTNYVGSISSVKLVDAPSCLGFLSKYVLLLCNSVEESLKGNVVEVSSKDVFTSAVTELSEHLFLATQSVEMLVESVRNNRTDQLELCLHTFLIDSAVAVEQYLVSQTIINKKSFDKIHSLVALGTMSGCALNQENMRYLSQHNKALLWARYFQTSVDNFNKRGMPLPLQWMQILSKETKSKEEIIIVLQGVFESYRGLINLVTGSEISSQAHVTEFLNQLEKLSKIVCDQVSEKGSKKIAAIQVSQKERELLSTMQNQIGNTVKKCLYAQECEEGDPLLPLKETVHYLRWIGLAYDMRADYGKNRALQYWLHRNLLHVDKLFKHLYTSVCILDGMGYTMHHDLKIYLECLADSDNWKKMDERSQAVVKALNLGITQHYLTKSSPVKSQCDRLLAYSKNEVLATDDGFSVVTKDKAVSDVTELTSDLFRLINDGIGVFVAESNQAVAMLEKINKEIEQQHRSSGT